ncbi:hypothetical protein KKA33_00665 [Patescibacteria group bacterium]|nr:hypothetical protein [Patescibacteria group bacterium]
MKKLIILSLIFLSGCSFKGLFYPTQTEPDMPPSDGIVCTEDYDPVCAKVQVQCIKAPCNPVLETFSNRCFAKLNSNVIGLVGGKCEIALKDACKDDRDCKLPMDYAIRSNCPYQAKCLDRQCVVVCPLF